MRRLRLWYVEHFDQAWRFGPHRLRDRFIPILSYRYAMFAWGKWPFPVRLVKRDGSSAIYMGRHQISRRRKP